MSCMGRLEGPVDFGAGDALPFLLVSQLFLEASRLLAPDGPSGGRKAWPCLAEGTAHRRHLAEPTSSPRSEGQDHRVQEPQGTDLPSLDIPL